MVKKGAFEKMVLQKTKSWGKEEDHKGRNNKTNRILITINILGSSGPIRLVVNETDVVSCVIETALKTYDREGRLPVLGSDATNFFLYCPEAGFDGKVAYPVVVFLFYCYYYFYLNLKIWT